MLNVSILNFFQKNLTQIIFKRFVIVFSLYVILISCTKKSNELSTSEAEEQNEFNALTNQARVVGYLPFYRFSELDNIAFCNVTHLNIAFFNPDENGNLILPESQSVFSLTDIIETAKSQNPSIKVFISLAGGALSDYQSRIWKSFLDDGSQRSILIKKIINYIRNNDFDGVDIDLEWEHVSSGYSNFILELKAAMILVSKSLSAAFPSETLYSNLTSEAIAALDFINIMAYDYTGPWNPKNIGHHSSFIHAENGIKFWRDVVGVPPEKLNLGVPFYGWDFKNSTTVVAKTYGSVVDANTSNSEKDVVGNFFYNGMETIRSKTRLAAEEVGGIMIWELGQDAFNDFSLLQTIHNSYLDLGVETTGLCKY